MAGTSSPEFQLKVLLWVPQSQSQFSIRISVYFENSFSLASNRLVGTHSIELTELWGLDEQVVHPPVSADQAAPQPRTWHPSGNCSRAAFPRYCRSRRLSLGRTTRCSRHLSSPSRATTCTHARRAVAVASPSAISVAARRSATYYKGYSKGCSRGAHFELAPSWYDPRPYHTMPSPDTCAPQARRILGGGLKAPLAHAPRPHHAMGGV